MYPQNTTAPCTTTVPLAQAAHALGLAMKAYHAVPASRESPDETRAVVGGMHSLFRTMLPLASNEMLDALTTLCTMETARQRLEQQADNGTLPGAAILPVPGLEQ